MAHQHIWVQLLYLCFKQRQHLLFVNALYHTLVVAGNTEFFEEQRSSDTVVLLWLQLHLVAVTEKVTYRVYM